ncbi:MAG: DUF3168 domain-containing protein [Clostridiales bacterium]|nr:DUF3168 domain-containing protein [Clostridiales bacterium]
MDPQQELFSALRKALAAEFGEASIYDSVMPPENTPYPFVYLADAIQTDMDLKGAVMGEVSITVHVWHDDPKARGTVSDMMLRIKKRAREIEITKDRSWMIRNNLTSQRIIADTTTKAPLLHGIVSLNYFFS